MSQPHKPGNVKAEEILGFLFALTALYGSDLFTISAKLIDYFSIIAKQDYSLRELYS